MGIGYGSQEEVVRNHGQRKKAAGKAAGTVEGVRGMRLPGHLGFSISKTGLMGRKPDSGAWINIEQKNET